MRGLARLLVWGTLPVLLSLVPASPWFPSLRAGTARGESDALGTGPFRVLWRVDVGRSVEQPLLRLGSALFVGSTDGRVQRLDAATGQRRWAKRFRDGLIEGPVAADRGFPVDTSLVFIATGIGRSTLHALETTHGKSLWDEELRSEVVDLRGDGTSIFALEESGRLSSFAPEDGTKRWTQEFAAWDAAGLALLGERLVLASRVDSIWGLDRGTGEVRWRRDVRGHVAAPPSVERGAVWLALTSGRVVALDPETGEVRGTWDGDPWLGAAPQVDDGVLLTVTSAGRVRARVLDAGDTASDGQVVAPAVTAPHGEAVPRSGWMEELDLAVQVRPVPAGRVVLCGTRSGDLVALRRATGERVWSLPLEGGFRVEPQIEDGTLLIATDRGNVYVYGIDG